MSTPENIALAVLQSLVTTVGIERVIKIVSDLAGGKDRAQAIIAAQYAANDIAVDVYERQTLKDFKP